MKEFIRQLYDAHEKAKPIPSPAQVCNWLDGLLKLLFPELSDQRYRTLREFENKYYDSTLELYSILEVLKDELPDTASSIENAFLAKLPNIREILLKDAQALLSGDPAAQSMVEVIRTYPGFLAVAVFRLAHEFYKLNVPLIPRILTEHIHNKTGIDIHPGATIDEGFCIDHGTGIVIGETVHIGKNVKIYQGVTLGALSVKKELAETKRHPTIEDNVVIYAGSTILGGNTVIGKNSIIGGNVWITKSVDPYSRIYYHDISTKFAETQ